jgi:hypothetical protein
MIARISPCPVLELKEFLRLDSPFVVRQEPGDQERRLLTCILADTRHRQQGVHR